MSMSRPFDAGELAQFVDSLPVVTVQIVVTGSSWHFAYVSAQAEKVLGISQQALLDKPRLFMEGMRKAHGKMFQSAIRSIQHKTSIVLEFKLEKPGDTEDVWLKFEARCDNTTDKGKTLNGVISDISDTKRAHIEVIDENDQLFQMLDSFPGFAYLQAQDYSIKYANKHFIQKFGGPGSGLCFEAIAGRKAPCPTCPTFEVFDGKPLVNWQAHNTKDNRIYDVYDMPFYGDDGELYVLEYGLDITDKMETERQLRLHSKVFEEAKEAMVIADRNKKIVSVNHAFEKITGCRREDAKERHLLNLCLGSEDPELNIDVELQLNQSGHWRGEVWRTTQEGASIATLQTISRVEDVNEGDAHYIASITDITEMAEHYRELQKIAHLDPLTGIPNRTLLDDRLEQAMKSCEREGRVLVVVYIDLDNFKTINKTHGHTAGDHVLKQVAKRLVGVLRNEDTVARVGGDEFMVLMPNVPRPNEFNKAIERIQQAFEHPVDFKNTQINVQASLGACAYPDDADCKLSLFARADEAMTSAKTTGKNRFILYQDMTNPEKS